MSRVVLALDTTGHGGSVALARGGRVLSRVDHDAADGYAEELFTLTDRALAEAGIGRASIEAVAVVSGPGSFTGLRIGVVTAKAIAAAAGLELLHAPTLELLAGAGGESSAAATEAGRSHCWWRGPAGRPACERVPIEDLVRRAAEGGCIAVREGQLLETLTRSGLRPVAVGPLSEILAVGASLGLPPARAADTDALVPFYGGPSQAERTHGIDLGEEVHRPIEPTGWS